MELTHRSTSSLRLPRRELPVKHKLETWWEQRWSKPGARGHTLRTSVSKFQQGWSNCGPRPSFGQGMAHSLSSLAPPPQRPATGAPLPGSCRLHPSPTRHQDATTPPTTPFERGPPHPSWLCTSAITTLQPALHTADTGNLQTKRRPWPMQPTGQRLKVGLPTTLQAPSGPPRLPTAPACLRTVGLTQDPDNPCTVST